MKRRQFRAFFLLFLFAFGGFALYDGFVNGGEFFHAPSYVLGVMVLGLCALGALGVNIWYGGPLDPRNDPDPAPVPQTPRQVAADWATRRFMTVGEFAESFWIVFGQMALLVFAAIMAAGIVHFLRIPYLAYANGVAPEHVAMRCLDTHEAEPMYLIKGYEERTLDIGMKWDKPRDLRKFVTQTSPAGFLHTAYNHRDEIVGQQETTTPHTRLTSAQIGQARRGLESVYDVRDPLVWSQVLAWGETLFLRWWAQRFDPDSADVASPLPFVQPWRGTDDEKIWFAWQRLVAGGNEDDLLKLIDAAKKAYPQPADYEAALAWAQVFHDRRERYYLDWRKQTGRLDVDKEWIGARVLPPATEFTLAWILDRHVGLTEASQAMAQKRWVDYFPHKEAVARRWGKELERARRQAGDPLPPTADNVALVCAIEHLTDWDPAGTKARHVALSLFGRDRLQVQMALTIAYPSDEMFKALASGDALDLVTLRGWNFVDRSQPLENLVWLAGWFVFLAVFAFIFRAVVLDTLGARALRMTDHDRFRTYYDSQTSKDVKGLLLAFLLIPLAKWVWEWWRITPPYELLMPTPFHLLAGVYMGVLAGGLLIATINRLAAIILLRVGVDVEKVWLDEIVGTSLGVALLAYFGNTWLSLTAFAAVAILPEAFKRWRKSRQAAPAHSSLDRQPILFENHPRAAIVGIALGAIFGGLLAVSMIFTF
jgi:hypothetical protein